MSIPRVLSKKNRILLAELTKTDFKLRYQGSVLGYLWALLRPLMMFAILYVVFAKLLRFGGDIPHYPVYLLAGTTIWSFFTECTSQGIQAMLVRGDLIRKISFPKYIVVVSATLTAVINMLINLIVVVVFAFINGVEPSWTWLLVPFSLIELYALALGIPITMVAETSTLAAKIILLNPLAQAIQDIRYNLITHETITTWNYISNTFLQIFPIILIIIILVLAVLYFRKKSKYFAEEI